MSDVSDLIVRCKAALDESDRLAGEARPGPWHWDAIGGVDDDRGTWSWQVTAGNWDLAVMCDADSPPPNRPNPELRRANARYIAANDPTTRLGLNAALRTVLEGIAGTLAVYDRGTAAAAARRSLYAIAQVLGAQLPSKAA